MILGKAEAEAELGGFPHDMGMGSSCLHDGKYGITVVTRTARTVPLHTTAPDTPASTSAQPLLGQQQMAGAFKVNAVWGQMLLLSCRFLV